MTPAPAITPLILGAGGMVGRALTLVLEEAFPCTVSATRAEVDVTDRARLEVEVERLRPSVLVNCAALNNPEACEEDPVRARGVNTEGAENAARVAAASGCRLVQISTALVFDGRGRTPYKESDPTVPTSVYGRTRLEGERRVAAAAPNHLIVRASWLYGQGCAGLVERVREAARAGENLRVADGEFGSPTCAADLAEALLRLFTVDFVGVVHFANSGVCSRYGMAKAILEAAGRQRTGLEPVAAADLGTAVHIANTSLDTSLYSRLTGNIPRSWQEALWDYLGTDTGAADA